MRKATEKNTTKSRHQTTRISGSGSTGEKGYRRLTGISGAGSPGQKGSLQVQKKEKWISDSEVLDLLFEKCVQKIKSGELELEVKDILNIIRMRQKIGDQGDKERRFWNMIEELKREGVKEPK